MGDIYRVKFKTDKPKAEETREMLVCAMSAVYKQLEAERDAAEKNMAFKTPGAKPSIFMTAFQKTGCLVSADGGVSDASMNPEGFRQAVDKLKHPALGDPFFINNNIDCSSYNAFFCGATARAAARSTAWSHSLADLTEEHLKRDKEKLASRFAELRASTHPIAVGICCALDAGFQWAGSSFITFLGQGVPAMLALLSAEGAHKSDIDLYVDPATVEAVDGDDDAQAPMTSPWGPALKTVMPRPVKAVEAKKRRGKQVGTPQVPAQEGWELEEKPEAKGNVLKHKFTVGSSKVHVHADVVKRGSWAKPSSDLFASLYCHATAGQLAIALYFVGPSFPPIELTLHNALGYGSTPGSPVQLHTFRAVVCPTGKAPDCPIEQLNVDGRFQLKLRSRVDKGLVTVVPVWLPWDFCGSAMVTKKRRKAKVTLATKQVKVKKVKKVKKAKVGSKRKAEPEEEEEEEQQYEMVDVDYEQLVADGEELEEYQEIDEDERGIIYYGGEKEKEEDAEDTVAPSLVSGSHGAAAASSHIDAATLRARPARPF